MTFHYLGLTKSLDFSGQKIIRIEDGSEPSNIWISFETDCDSVFDESMDISAVFRGITKQKTEYTGYGNWSAETYYQRFPCPDLTCKIAYPRYRWFKDMNLLHPSGNYNLFTELTNNHSWLFKDRKYDAIQLDLGVDRVHSNGEKYYLALHDSNIFIIYRPHYTITGLEYNKNGLVVSYNVSSGWNRTDDRFYVQNIYSLKSGREYKLIASGCNAHLIAPGQFCIYHNDIINVPEPGESVSALFSIAPSYDPLFNDGENLVRYKGGIADGTKCNPIKVVPNEIGFGVSFAISEIQSGYERVERVVVKMEPAEFDFDTQELDKLPGVVQMDPPLNKRAVFSITPYGDGNTTNETKYYEAYIEANFVILTSIDSGESVIIRYNYLPSFTAKPDVNIVKFAGRDRPSAFYGTGGTIEGTITGTIVDEIHPNVDVPYNVETQNPGKFEIVHFFGDCLLKTPDSTRRVVSVSSIDVNTKSTNMLHVKDISIKMTEVR